MQISWRRSNLQPAADGLWRIGRARKSGFNPGSLSFALRGRCASCARHAGVSDPRSTWIWSIVTTGCWFTDGASKSPPSRSEQPRPRPSNRCKTGSCSAKLPRSLPVLVQSLDPWSGFLAAGFLLGSSFLVRPLRLPERVRGRCIHLLDPECVENSSKARSTSAERRLRRSVLPFLYTSRQLNVRRFAAR